MSFSAHPDWRLPMQIGERLAYALYDRPGGFALPDVAK